MTRLVLPGQSASQGKGIWGFNFPNTPCQQYLDFMEYLEGRNFGELELEGYLKVLPTETHEEGKKQMTDWEEVFSSCTSIRSSPKFGNNVCN